MKEGSWGRQLDSDTVVGSDGIFEQSVERSLGLTILAHPAASRIGERALLPTFEARGEALVSRVEPFFSAPGSDHREPLSDPYLSRSPLRLKALDDGGLCVDAGQSRTAVRVDGSDVRSQEFGSDRLDMGIVLLLAQRHALLVHRMPMPLVDSPERFGLMGHSMSMVRLQHELLRVADLDVPVLLQGETGTGKELAARALHAASPRREKPFVAVNVAALPPTLAAAELFGAEKGAYTGADRRRRGHFEQCDGGTLFLDEVGEMPSDVQVLLLRALELKEIQPVGSEQTRPVDVRVIAATDGDLEKAAAAGDFRAPLLYRLSGYEIELPPLRQRREDIGRLLVHFLRRELETIDELDKLADPGPRGEPWLSAAVVARLTDHDWPGNVRQLLNVTRQLVIGSRGSQRLQLTPQVERLLAEKGAYRESARELPQATRRRAPSQQYRDPDTVTDDELLEVLKRHDWRIKDAAVELGVSRTSLYALIDRSSRVRKASDLSRREIEEARDRVGDDSVDALANQLEVSKKALKMRMKELGMR